VSKAESLEFVIHFHECVDHWLDALFTDVAVVQREGLRGRIEVEVIIESIIWVFIENCADLEVGFLEKPFDLPLLLG